MHIGEYELESPIMNAGGVVKTVEDVRMMARTGVGAVVAGSSTLDARDGNGPNGETVYYHDETTGITYNALGMPNEAFEEAAEKVPDMIAVAHEYNKPLILNLAPVTDKPEQEIADMLAILSYVGIKELDAVELNASCPNVVTENGGRHELLSHHPEALGRVLLELHDISANKLHINSLFVRISPFRDTNDALLLAQLLKNVPVDVVSAFNTFPGGAPLNDSGEAILKVPGGAGGQSGPGKALEAEEQTTWLTNARESMGANFEIIGSNGIIDAKTMKRRLNLGASAVSLTTLFYENQNWNAAVDRILQDYSN